MELRKLRDELIYHADGLRKEQESFGSNDGMKKLQRFAEDETLLKTKLTEAHKEYHSAFHSRWGQMVSIFLLKFSQFVFKCRHSIVFYSLLQAIKILDLDTLSRIMRVCTQVKVIMISSKYHMLIIVFTLIISQ